MTVGTITAVTVTEAGVAATMAAATATDGDKVRNDNSRGRTMIVVTNGGASPTTVSIAAVQTSTNIAGYGTVTKANAGGSVAAGATKYFGPFPACFENATGFVTAICSIATDVTIGALTLPALTS